MNFASVLFLFFFFPLTFAAHWLMRQEWRNALLVAMSVLFYAWGGGFFLFLLIASTVANYYLAQKIEEKEGKRRRDALGAAIALNLTPLLFYKYGAFVAGNLGLDSLLGMNGLLLPIGISFFTFHAISYCIDVYRADAKASRSFSELALYMMLFPQLIAGPIIRYKTIAPQLLARTIGERDVFEGMTRFIRGLAKKVIIADTLAHLVDSAFNFSPHDAGAPLLIVAALFYALQIYFDFSGYTDMAIGMGRMLGFSFPENFNFPYAALSVQAFWRRWHMSLTTWFRDYVYIPLGGNKRGLVRTCLNTAVVFLFVGAWHGANWTFIFWGAWFTLFLILERLFPLPDTKRSRPLQRAYVLLVVLIGWILFRSSTLSDALQRLMVIATFAGGTEAADVRIFVSPFVLLVFACALMIATPLPQQMLLQARQNISPGRLEILSFIYHAVLLVFAMLVVAASAYRPFIYFQF